MTANETLTPSEIEALAREHVRNSYPKKGTIIVIVAYNETVSFIVPVSMSRVVNFMMDRVEKNKAWSTEIFKTLISTTPCLPLPKKLVAPIDLPIVKLDPQKKEVRWTEDGWITTEIRKMPQTLGATGPVDWESTTIVNKFNSDNESDNESDTKGSACMAGC